MSTTRHGPAGDFDYEAHGSGYATHRRPDPRIAAIIHRALGPARTVLNVGAGTGSYEPSDRYLVAVEPSAVMRAQRPAGRPAVDAVAEQLPFDDGSFDAAMATLTVHQWRDLGAGLHEMRRVSRGPVVVLTFDPDALERFWLAEYVPEVITVERRRFPPIERITAALGGRCEVVGVPVPVECTDGFGEAYYGRPEAFFDAGVRAAQSGWVLAGADAVAAGLGRLRAALDSGAWDARHGGLRRQPQRVGALRLVVAHPR